ncbi:hypothetical protein BM1_04278 [Bipolaris maydis]|nr:hypothetical protein BM1_04278 [Bipolaris maydis]
MALKGVRSDRFYRYALKRRVSSGSLTVCGGTGRPENCAGLDAALQFCYPRKKQKHGKVDQEVEDNLDEREARQQKVKAMESGKEKRALEITFYDSSVV